MSDETQPLRRQFDLLRAERTDLLRQRLTMLADVAQLTRERDEARRALTALATVARAYVIGRDGRTYAELAAAVRALDS